VSRRPPRAANKQTRRACVGCNRMAGEPRVIDGTEIDLCAECNADHWDRQRALNKVRGEPAGIQPWRP
jgi:hypothetical protein